VNTVPTHSVKDSRLRACLNRWSDMARLFKHMANYSFKRTAATAALLS